MTLVRKSKYVTIAFPSSPWHSIVLIQALVLAVLLFSSPNNPILIPQGSERQKITYWAEKVLDKRQKKKKKKFRHEELMASHISSKNTDLESIAYRSTPKFSSSPNSFMLLELKTNNDISKPWVLLSSA